MVIELDFLINFPLKIKAKGEKYLGLCQKIQYQIFSLNELSLIPLALEVSPYSHIMTHILVTEGEYGLERAGKN